MRLIIPITMLLFLLSGCDSGNDTPSNKQQDTITKNKSNQKLLVILVDFKDAKIEENDEYWSNKFFHGRLNKFVSENSLNKFEYRPMPETNGTKNDGIVRISLDYNHPRPLSSSSDEMKKIIPPALRKATDYISLYNVDKNNDNILTTDEIIPVFVIAGQEAAVSGYGDFPSIWAHSWYIKYVEAVTVGNKYFAGKYALFGEKHGKHPATIGIIAHELGHATFDLPDLYDTTGHNTGIGAFGLMAYGSWNSTVQPDGTRYAGNSPAQFTAWSKLQTGWIKAKEYKGNINATIPLYSNTNNNYNIIKINMTNTEYLLIENMANNLMEAGKTALIPNYIGGIAVWHVDEEIMNVNKAKNQVQKDVNHKGLDLIEAKNNNIDNNRYGDGLNLFFNGNITDLNNDSNPSTKMYSGQASNINIKVLSDVGNEMLIDIKKETK